MKLSVVLAVLAAAASAFAAPIPEPTCKDLNSLWSQTYYGDFKVEWPKAEFTCPSGVSKTAQAIHDLHNADTAHDFYTTVKNLTTGTLYLDSCDKDTVAWMSVDGKLSICNRFYTVDPEKRASTLFHEASHARAIDPKHVKCGHGDADGKIACDESFTGNYETGSGYNWEVHYLRYVKNNPSANDLTRWVSEGHLKFLLNNRFNRITAEQLKTWSR